MNKQELISWLDGVQSTISILEDLSNIDIINIVSEIIATIELELDVPIITNKIPSPNNWGIQRDPIYHEDHYGNKPFIS